VLEELRTSSSFPINWERNDPGNAGNEMNPGNDQAHFIVRVKMPAICGMQLVLVVDNRMRTHL
jgi:hypothetical protein